jgi:hypothetical protein
MARSGNRVGLRRGRKPLKTSNSVRYAGTGRSEHWKALERLPDAARTPWESRVSSEIRWIPDGPKTLGRQFDAVWFAQPQRTQAREGTSGGESSCDGPGLMCSEGGLERLGTVATEPGRAGSSAFEPAELATSYSSEFEAVEQRRRKGAADAETRPGLPDRKVFRVETP